MDWCKDRTFQEPIDTLTNLKGLQIPTQVQQHTKNTIIRTNTLTHILHSFFFFFCLTVEILLMNIQDKSEFTLTTAHLNQSNQTLTITHWTTHQLLQQNKNKKNREVLNHTKLPATKHYQKKKKPRKIGHNFAKVSC